MKRTKNSKRKFRLLPGCVLYFVLLAFSVVLTQLLRNPASGALFLFILILPVISLIHCLIGRSAIQAFVTSDAKQTEKNRPLEYEIRITNNSIFSFPFVEAVLSEPGTNVQRCTKRKLILSLVPHGFYTVKNTVSFKYRGLYEIGVDSLYINDLFRFFALRADMENYTAISVFPRKLSIADDRGRSDTDAPSPKLKNDVAAEKIEFSDVRDYVPGDSVRSIHWKLSSKTQDIKVRQYSSAENKHVYVFCDMAEAAVPPKKKDAGELYKSLRRAIEEENKKDKKNKLRRAISENSAKEEDPEALASYDPASDKKAARKKRRAAKRRDNRYRKNVRAGMDEKAAETIRSIDELISATAKKKGARVRDPDPEEKVTLRTGEAAQGASKTESDLKRILEITGVPGEEEDLAAKYFGGRVREDSVEDYNEYCSDAVVEMTLAAVASELRNGNVCTVCWFDEREERGVCAVTLNGIAEYEEVFNRLATAACVPHESYVTNLSSVVGETSNVKIKIVTSNIDPQSAAEIRALPAKFGGAGTGCSTESLIFSPVAKYEDPPGRAVYTADVCSEFMRNGVSPHLLAESADSSGSPVFVTAA